jgi:N-carbamoyl-L-amino-acid hydrolase
VTVKSPRINFDRLKKDLRDLAEIGRSEDRGIYRMAFTGADMRAREWLESRIRASGLAVSRDGAANIFGRYKCREDRPSILVGSHLDTVPGGGDLDGALGVLTALECLRRVKEEHIPTRFGLEMVAFSDEEGRFGGPFGSLALTGGLVPEKIHTATDLNGVSLKDEMARHGFDARDALHARRHPETVRAYLEMHIEQGPVLDRKNIRIGIVEGITGLFKWSARFMGQADHAGTTPFAMRKDAFLGLAEFAGEIPRVLEEHGSENSRATIGNVELFPGTANTVPGQVDFSLDVREIEKTRLDELSDAFRRVLSAIGRRRGLMFEFEVLSSIDPVRCDDFIVSTIKAGADIMGIEYFQMPSGAVHDAQIMAAIAPVGMIFVPSIEGRSHSPAEWTHWEDMETGANLMLRTLVGLIAKE